MAYGMVVATSTAVERVFSAGRHLLPFTRNRLSGRSIRRFMCLGDWSRKDIISTEDIVQSIQSRFKKAKRDRDSDDQPATGSEKRARMQE
jgi:hypothetical protein